MLEELLKLGRSFRCAFRGLSFLFSSQRNARIHLAAVAGVVIAGAMLDISPLEWTALILAMGLVISAEALNTSLEILADRITLEPDPAIGRAKDVAAGAVLLAAMCAFVTGLFVFVPRILAA